MQQALAHRLEMALERQRALGPLSVQVQALRFVQRVQQQAAQR
jgi:hypothetical protein